MECAEDVVPAQNFLEMLLNMEAYSPRLSVPSIISKDRDLFICPICNGDIGLTRLQEIKCSNCGKIFAREDNIPLLFRPNGREATAEDVTDEIKVFYEEKISFLTILILIPRIADLTPLNRSILNVSIWG